MHAVMVIKGGLKLVDFVGSWGQCMCHMIENGLFENAFIENV